MNVHVVCVQASRRRQQNLRRAALFGVAGVVGALSAYAIYKAYQGGAQSKAEASSAPPIVDIPTAALLTE